MGRPKGLFVKDFGESESGKEWESSDIDIINNCILCSHGCMEEGEIEFTKHWVHLAIYYYTRNFLFC